MVDIPGNQNTDRSLTPGEQLTSWIESAGDRDWVRLDADRDAWIQVELDGRGNGALSDPYLRIYDRNGNLVAEDDDGGDTGYDAALTFQAAGRGPYYIEAAGWGDEYTGRYVLRTAEIPPPPAHDPLKWGTAVSDGAVSVYFARKDESFDGYTSEGWTPAELARFEAAFAQIASVANLTFTIATTPDADFQLVLDTNEIPTGQNSFLGYFNPPGEHGEGVGVFNGAKWDRDGGTDLGMGSYGYVTIVHELLHGLGLAHPHDDGGGSSIMPGVTQDFDDFGDHDLNQGIFTTMSYNSGYLTGSAGSAPSTKTFGYEAGPMALDIAVLQDLYGAVANATGDDVYHLHNRNAPGTYWQAIWDTDGNDKLQYDGGRDVNIDLRDATLLPGAGAGGYVSAAKGIAGGYTIAAGAMIERAQSDRGDDRLTGNGQDNILKSGRGDDHVSGRAGDDLIQLGNGADRADGAKGNDRIYGGTGRDTLDGGLDHDMLRGEDGADMLRGDDGDDALIGGRGNDVIRGGAGQDMMTGGTGRDTFDFQSVGSSRAEVADVITDFTAGRDQIDLSGMDADTTTSGAQSFDFIGNAAFSAAGQLRVARDGDDRIIQADRNGDGEADFAILLLGAAGLGADDFIL